MIHRGIRREIHEAVDAILDMLLIAIEDEVEKKRRRTRRKKPKTRAG